MAGQAKGISIFPGFETQWNNAHSHKITSVDSLETLGNDRFHTLQHLITEAHQLRVNCGHEVEDEFSLHI